ncbi:MAG: hypothetical protein D6800_05180 [Candidatus Zixiibacteriota bacterium]|nr:MAG: hypothetical protein D6800_05180 [candidate division Zixibacteria bacterium]
MKQLLTALFFSIILTAVVRGDGITVTQELDRTEIPFEQTATLQVKLTWPGPMTAYLIEGPLRPELEKLKVGRFSSSVTSRGTGADEVTTKTYTFTLQPTASGVGRILPMEVHYVSLPDSIPGTLTTDALELTIAEKKPVSTSGSGVLNAGLMVGLLTILLVALAGVVIYRRQKSRQAREPVVSPSQTLVDALSKLRSETGSDLKRFRAGAFPLITAFLADRYGVATAGQSAGQIVEQLSRLDLSERQREQLETWLVECEQAKYSPVTSAPGDVIRLETEMRQFFGQLT